MNTQGTRTPDHPITAQEFQRRPDDPEGYREELVRGRIVRSPPLMPLHGRIVVRIAERLNRFVEDHGLGVVLSDSGYGLARDPDTVRGPDVSFVSSERIPRDAYAGGYWWLGPDLAVEVVSPSNTFAQLQEKVQDYLGAGSREVWIVDPAARRVVVHAPRGAVTIPVEQDTLEGRDLLPGFELRSDLLFAL
ncbi:MAG: Uma2 family endonuclease [Longimicrobiales bacterium]